MAFNDEIPDLSRGRLFRGISRGKGKPEQREQDGEPGRRAFTAEDMGILRDGYRDEYRQGMGRGLWSTEGEYSTFTGDDIAQIRRSRVTSSLSDGDRPAPGSMSVLPISRAPMQRSPMGGSAVSEPVPAGTSQHAGPARVISRARRALPISPDGQQSASDGQQLAPDDQGHDSVAKASAAGLVSGFAGGVQTHMGHRGDSGPDRGHDDEHDGDASDASAEHDAPSVDPAGTSSASEERLAAKLAARYQRFPELAPGAPPMFTPRPGSGRDQGLQR